MLVTEGLLIVNNWIAFFWVPNNDDNDDAEKITSIIIYYNNHIKFTQTCVTEYHNNTTLTIPKTQLTDRDLKMCLQWEE